MLFMIVLSRLTFSINTFSHSKNSLTALGFDGLTYWSKLTGTRSTIFQFLIKVFVLFCNFLNVFSSHWRKVRLDAGRKSIKLDSWIRKWSFSIRSLVCLCSVFWIFQLTPTHKTCSTDSCFMFLRSFLQRYFMKALPVNVHKTNFQLNR